MEEKELLKKVEENTRYIKKIYYLLMGGVLLGAGFLAYTLGAVF